MKDYLERDGREGTASQVSAIRAVDDELTCTRLPQGDNFPLLNTTVDVRLAE